MSPKSQSVNGIPNVDLILQKKKKHIINTCVSISERAAIKLSVKIEFFTDALKSHNGPKRL